MNYYTLRIWDFEKIITAETPGKAKYQYWTHLKDAYDIPFIQFLRRVKCVKM